MTSAATLATDLSVTVNGDRTALPRGTTVAGLLQRLDATGKRVAVERNGEIVPRSMHAATALNDGDRLEVVIAVGGG